MLFRALAVWLLLVALAILNAGARNAWITPVAGELAGHVISSITFGVIIFAVAWLFVGWMRPANRAQALGLGFFWLLLTVLFEFGAGHYLFGNSWEKLVADYNIFRERIWVLVLLATFLAPFLTARLRGFIL
ncbi:MAG: hypothetical protein L0196_03055 [candidate division Zixibacteria bacterium]|nr:hypothetical protein [candidate division Zixibacteria bacterium]